MMTQEEISRVIWKAAREDKKIEVEAFGETVTGEVDNIEGPGDSDDERSWLYLFNEGGYLICFDDITNVKILEEK
jgi:hypothetical protein